MDKPEIYIDIANLSFCIEKVEEVGMAKIFTKNDYPDGYSVFWSEWVTNENGSTVKAEAEAQTYRIKKIQKFDNYELARQFFLKKVDEISQCYKEYGIKK